MGRALIYLRKAEQTPVIFADPGACHGRKWKKMV
jgi:hypothetical protein